MNPPDHLPTFRPPSAADRPLAVAARERGGDEVLVAGDLADQRFASPGRRRVVGGETWSDLAAEGVDAVTLFEHDRRVYGPMSLHA